MHKRAGDRYRKQADSAYTTSAEAYAERDERKWRSPGVTALAFREVVAERRPRSVLELGVGTGRYFPYLSGEDYLGLDVCDAMLARAKAREHLLREAGFRNVEFALDEIEGFLQRNAAGRQFDLVFSIGCLGLHVPVTPELMRSIACVMAPDGVLFLQTTQRSWIYRIGAALGDLAAGLGGNGPSRGFFCYTTPLALRQAAQAAGLEVEWLREDTSRWTGLPLLLSLYRNPSGVTQS